MWRATVIDAASGERREIAARALVNAAGPWVDGSSTRMDGARTKFAVKLVKGSRIVVPKFCDGPQAYLMQNHDRRVIFVIPYQGDLALIGTTDIPFEGAPETVAADEDEIVYLLAAVAGYFRNAPKREDVIKAWSGVRPLFDDGHGDPSAITRDYVSSSTQPTARRCSTFRRQDHHLPPARRARAAKAQTVLPDGARRLDGAGDAARRRDRRRRLRALRRQLGDEYPFLPPALARHYARLYGARALKLLGPASSLADLGRSFGPGFYESEARYLVAKEWARTADDILVRRTKHGLRITAHERAEFESWLQSEVA